MNVFHALSCAVVLFASAGCGGSDYVPVSGKVTWGGDPLPNAHVTFSPALDSNDPSQNGTQSVGLTNAKGAFTLVTVIDGEDGALPGDHHVYVTLQDEDAEQKDVPDLDEFTLPAMCRDGSIRITIPVGGTDTADIEIPKTMPPP